MRTEHCHLPFGIFTQVSVKRSVSLIALPDASVPFPLKIPVAIVASP